ncbi:hypothetical protein IC757_13220 [Wenzhouxiangella sp. AB-CW3]|uniref:hypothetical protein n=1 Tax=Wenzhouxiangella sp. AB-CW3 TaxID=2771012 RepID=UPI00168A7537|nr:hypothetical protein [Wenzhouxiangella sp. AB-CW3]QOC21978.1 hypothetical protein IC757_13220 [Wenzhouxiangella sp. AB-CW3]
MINIKPALTFIALTLAGGSALAANADPHVEGSLVLTMDKGMLEGNLCVSGLAEADEYEFLLNRGLNLRAIRSSPDGDPLAYQGFFNAVSEGDATRYSVSGLFPEQSLCVEYVGAYPIYDVDAGERSTIDWKGQIAFDGSTVRATEQARFYPVPIDPVSGAPLQRVTFDIHVSCSTCNAIYIGGSAPVVGQHRARFQSTDPRALLLYAGSFPVLSTDDAHFLGAEVSPKVSVAINQEVVRIARTLERFLGIEYDERPALLSFASVSREHQLGEVDWAFLTWPTIALSGRRPFAALMEEQDGELQLTPDKQMLISHEMAHYFFGGRYMPRGPLVNFLLESTAEFLALQVIRELDGDARYEAQLGLHYQEVASSEMVPMDQVERAPQLSGDFPFRIGPLLLVVLAERIGEDVLMRALSKLVLESPRDPVNYADFRSRLLAAGANEKILKSYEKDCFLESVAASCLKDRFSSNAGGNH